MAPRRSKCNSRRCLKVHRFKPLLRHPTKRFLTIFVRFNSKSTLQAKLNCDLRLRLKRLWSCSTRLTIQVSMLKSRSKTTSLPSKRLSSQSLPLGIRSLSSDRTCGVFRCHERPSRPKLHSKRHWPKTACHRLSRRRSSGQSSEVSIDSSVRQPPQSLNPLQPLRWLRVLPKPRSIASSEKSQDRCSQ